MKEFILWLTMHKFFSFIFKQKKILILVLLALVITGIIAPQVAFAWDSWQDMFSDCFLNPRCIFSEKSAVVRGTVAGIIGGLITIIGSLILGMTALFSFISGTLLNWVLVISTKVSYTSTDPLYNPVIATGWPIVRDFANIIIVLGLVIIALATILRFKNYETRQLLVKLIVAALLINFSLVICGVVIDISNVLISYFLGNGNAWAFLSNDQGFEVALNFSKNAAKDTPLVLFSRLFANVFFNIMQGVINYLYVFLFLFRIFALWVLVLLSPLAFACYVFPKTKTMIFDKWLNNFLQWAFIGALGAMFIFLANKINIAMSKAGTGIANFKFPEGNGPGKIFDFIGNDVTKIFTFFVPGMFLVIGFIISLQVSAAGANYAVAGFKRSGNAIARAGKWTRKFAADNIGYRGYTATSIKDAVVDRATRIGESLRLINRGTADTNKKVRQSGKLDEKGRVERANDMNTQQKLAVARETPLTQAAGLNQAAVLKSMTKEEFGLLSNDEQIRLLRNSEQNGYGLKPHEMVTKMSTANQNRVVREDMFDSKTRGEALKSLAGKGQINSSSYNPAVATSALNQDEIIRAMQDARDNGSDLKDIISGLEGQDLADIIGETRTAAAMGEELFDGATRVKLLKALGDKKQTDLLTQVELMDEMRLAAINGMKLPDIVGKLDSANQAHIIENNLFNPETRAKVVESLAKKGRLDLIPVASRSTAFTEAMDNGVDAEDLEKADYHAAEFNQVRIQRLIANGVAPANAPTEARRQVLDSTITKMDGDQLRGIDRIDITADRIEALTPEKVLEFRYASTDRRTEIRTTVRAALDTKRTAADADYNIAQVAGEVAKAEKALDKWTKLDKLIKAIDLLP